MSVLIMSRTWRVNYEQAGHPQVERAAVAEALGADADVVTRHIGGTDLLSDAPSLAILHVGSSHVVQNLGFACEPRLCRRHQMLWSPPEQFNDQSSHPSPPVIQAIQIYTFYIYFI